MPTRLTHILEPIFSDPGRLTFIRSVLQSGLKVEKMMLLKAVKKGNLYRSVLDFGCGTGEFSELFSPSAYYGTDIDKSVINHAKVLHPKYRFSVINRASNLNGKYDLILLISTVHHLSPAILKAALSQFQKRLLKKNGALLIMDPVHPKEQRRLFGNWLFSNDRGDFQRTKRQVFSKIANKFKVISYDTFQENLLTFYLLIAKPIKK